MKILNRNYLIFGAICTLLFVYFYFVQYFFTINFYDTYYVISYFYLVLPMFIIGTLFYLKQILAEKLKERIMQSPNRYYSKGLLYFLEPNLYLKLNTLTRNYLIFVVICLFLLIYLYIMDCFYFAYFNGSFQFIKYYYFVLPFLIIGSIYYGIKVSRIKGKKIEK
ncbi:hypothetical protein [Flavobacterium chilense]|uniref:Uncharacterized protein n=1 Tax=Flavobacterium chilense TaxID=946677 RepID=A0A1M7J9E6_9FLAO|nr:hypothetical protein [Flavobacterium chilense]SHM49493.1 hypothetical protein SAMN05444484_106228 [Flavobacterium chilense]